MFNKLLTLSIFLLAFSSAHATKNDGIIYGKVVEKESGNALSYATVYLQDNSNKILGGATSSETGNFSINNVTSGNLKVKISFIGYKDTTLSVNISSTTKELNLGNICLSQNALTLKSAVVNGKIPAIEHKLDKLVMNVAEAISTEGSTAMDILRKAPGIGIDPSGKILLNGSPVEVWIDNRPSYLSGEELEAMLSGTDGSTIDKIEIIAHPSSKYDAAGSGGIINIKTKRNFAKGLNGSAKVGYSLFPKSRYFYGTDGALNLSYRTDKNAVNINYSPRYSELFNNFKSTTNLDNGMIIKGNTWHDYSRENHNFKFSDDYFANKKNTFGFIISGYDKNTDAKTYDPLTTNILYMNGASIQETKTKIKSEEKSNNIFINLNYTHTFEEGRDLTANIDLGHYNLGSNSFQSNDFIGINDIMSRASEIFRSNSDQDINIKSAKIDYEQKLGKTGMLEAGLKFAKTNTENDLVREDKIDNSWVHNNQLSSVFNYSEVISAAYLSLTKQINEKLNMKIGLRSEMTDAKGDWISSDTTTSKKYVNIFPSLFIGYVPSENFNLTVSYSYRLQRPNFEQLNPFREYVDANSSEQGNPDLDPQYTHEVSITSGIYKYFNIGIIGNFTDGLIIQNTTVNQTTGEKLLDFQNFGKSYIYGGVFSLTELPVGRWIKINGSYVLMNAVSKSKGYKSSSLGFQGTMSVSCSLPDDYKIELSGNGMTGIPYGYFKIKPMANLSFAAKKTFLDKKATLALTADDILKTMRSRAIMNNGVLKNYTFESRWASQKITISFSYRFGQGKTQKMRNVGISDEAKRVSTEN